MAFLNTYDLAKAASFRPKVTIGMVKVAAQVAVEDTSAMSEGRATKRRALAELCLRQPEHQTDIFVWSVLANPVIAQAGLDASDGDVEYQVNQVFDSLAGVTNAELAPPA